MRYEIRSPGSSEWQSREDFPGGVVPVGGLVGSLVRYHTGDCPLVFKVTGLSDPDAAGNRSLQMELHTPELPEEVANG